MPLSFSRDMDLKVPDSVSPSTDTSSPLMNSLPVGECEHLSLFSILTIQEHEFGRGFLWAKIEPLHHHEVHIWTFAETVGVRFNSSLGLQARFVRVEVRDTCNCDVVDHPQLVISVSFLSHSSFGTISEPSLAIVRDFVLWYSDKILQAVTSIFFHRIHVPLQDTVLQHKHPVLLSPLLAFLPFVPRPWCSLWPSGTHPSSRVTKVLWFLILLRCHRDSFF